jgi:transcriptional regulator with XRE-family HTH domain
VLIQNPEYCIYGCTRCDRSTTFFSDLFARLGSMRFMADSWQYNQRIIGEILRRSRMRIGLSIRGLSARSGVSASQILRVESGEFDIMLSTLLKLARHLGIPAGLVLEQGALPNPGFYAKLIGQSGIPGLLTAIAPSKRPRNALTRVIMLGTQSAVAASWLLQSSHASKLVILIDFPLNSIRTTFVRFAGTIDQLDIEDRVSLQRQLDSEPIELLTRLELITPAIAAEFLAKVKEHSDLQPNFFHLV